ncbi:MAG TPA: hypothetical protein VHV49_11045 [Pseudonocardiaceae bacterium]|jgi:uncharacterized protein YukE|nr:hypothetical protein [Pseudonocardiaceae bacterium]
MTVDLQVQGDVDSVRGTATGMATLGGAIDDAGAGFGQASAASESSWLGAAGDAFRGRIGTARQATTAAAQAGKRMSTALHTFADRMATVKSEMARARSIAAGAELRVSGDSIQEPTPPPAPPAACHTPQAAAAIAHQQAAAQAKYRRQVRAYRQAEQLVDEARKQEQTAHEDVTRAADEERGVLAELNHEKYWLAGGAAAGVVAKALEQRATWAKRTQELGLLYDRLSRAATETEEPLAHTVLSDVAEHVLDRTADAAERTTANAKLSADIAPDSALGRFAGHLPAGIAAAQTAVSVVEAHGTKAKVVAGTSGVAGYAAGEAAAGATASALEGVSIAAAPETMGLSLVAGGVAFGTGMAVEHFGPPVYDWTTHAASNVAGTVAGAVTHPGDTLSSIGHALGL